MTLLDRQGPVTEPASSAVTPENVALLQAIELLWHDTSLSMLTIGKRLGVSRSRVAALIARERRRPRGIERLPARPKSESNRLAARRKRAIKAGVTLTDAGVKLTEAGRQLVRQSASAPKPAVLLVEKPRAPIALTQLKPGMCRYPINDPPPHGQFLFCAAPAPQGRYCEVHEAKTRVAPHR
jgi:hypothetical protein